MSPGSFDAAKVSWKVRRASAARISASLTLADRMFIPAIVTLRRAQWNFGNFDAVRESKSTRLPCRQQGASSRGHHNGSLGRYSFRSSPASERQVVHPGGG